MGVFVFIDFNYCKKFWKYGKLFMDVMLDLVVGCDVILGNEEDVEKYFGLYFEGVDVIYGGLVDGEVYLFVLK